MSVASLQSTPLCMELGALLVKKMWEACQGGQGDHSRQRKQDRQSVEPGGSGVHF